MDFSQDIGYKQLTKIKIRAEKKKSISTPNRAIISPLQIESELRFFLVESVRIRVMMVQPQYAVPKLVLFAFIFILAD